MYYLNIKFKTKMSFGLIFLVLLINYIFLSNVLYFFGITSSIFNYNYRSILISLIVLFGIFSLLFSIFVKQKLNLMILAPLLFTFEIFIRFILYENKTNIFAEITTCTIWFFTFFLSYFYTKNFEDYKKASYLCILSSFFIALLYIFKIININQTVSSVNSIYYILLGLPFILLLSNTIIKNIFLIIVSISVLISMKITALIALICSLILYYIIKYNKKYYNYFSIFILIFLFTIISLLYFKIKNLNGIDILAKFFLIEESGGSGRFDIYRMVINEQFKSNILEWIFGHGNEGVSKLIGISAHNDFLEVIFNFGLVGFSLYIIFWVTLIKIVMKLKNTYNQFYAPFLVSIVIFFCISIASNVIFVPTYFSYLTIFWGMTISLAKK